MLDYKKEAPLGASFASCKNCQWQLSHPPTTFKPKPGEPIIKLTVEEDWELVEASLAAGAIGYVAKPRLGIMFTQEHFRFRALFVALLVMQGVAPFLERDDSARTCGKL